MTTKLLGMQISTFCDVKMIYNPCLSRQGDLIIYTDNSSNNYSAGTILSL